MWLCEIPAALLITDLLKCNVFNVSVNLNNGDVLGATLYRINDQPVCSQGLPRPPSSLGIFVNLFVSLCQFFSFSATERRDCPLLDRGQRWHLMGFRQLGVEHSLQSAELPSPGLCGHGAGISSVLGHASSAECLPGALGGKQESTLTANLPGQLMAADSTLGTHCLPG